MHLVSDFDGVWTDPRAEANAIRALMIDRLAAAAGLSRERVEAAFCTLEHNFAEDPFNYGWIFESQITAFAGEDMYGRNHAVAACLWAGQPTIPDGEALKQAIADCAGSGDRLADICFKDARAAYREQNSMSLVPEAAGVVSQLHERGHKVTIVSNSKIAHILDLFEAANIEMTGIEVIGGARKFHLGAASAVPQYWSWNSGQISLQRPHYLELLERLKPDAVVGDVLSLDLALPLYLRSARPDWGHFRAGLIHQPYTPAWVIPDKAVAAAQGLDLLSGLAAVPDWLDSLDNN